MRSTLLASIALPALLLAACAAEVEQQPNGNNGTSSSAASEVSSANDAAIAIQAARLDLARELGVAAADIVVETTEARDWSDSCLGLGGPAESCLAAITPGYRIVLSYDGTEYVYRTDENGSTVRAE